MRRFLLLTAALLGAATTLPCPVSAADTAPRGDLAKLQGAWKAKVGPNKDIPIEYVFSGDAVRVHIKISGANSREIALKGRVVLDETAKPHKSVNWLRMTDANGKTLPKTLGIYTLEDDGTLKLCNALPGFDERPTAFPDPSSGKGAAIILTRTAEGEKAKETTKEEKSAATPCDEPKGKGKEKDIDKEEKKDKAPEPKGDLAKLQGDWTAKVGPEKNIEMVITIKGNTVTLKFDTPANGEVELKGELKIDEAAKPQKTIDWVKFIGPNGEAAPENLGIYDFPDADTVRFCSGGPGNERPTEFKQGEGGPPNLVVVKRKKESTGRQRGSDRLSGGAPTDFPPRPACGERVGVRGLPSDALGETRRPLTPALSPEYGGEGA